MSSTKVRQYLRSHVLGLVAIFVALSGTAIGADGPTASSSVVTDAKFKKLKRKVAGLTNKLNAPVQGGDLTGVFPNLQIAANAVTTIKLADNAVSTAKIQDEAVSTAKLPANAVTTAKIAADAVTDAKLAASSVGASELKAVSQPQSAQVGVGAGAENVASISCAAGEQILGGGGFWDSVDVDLRMLNSFPVGNSWTMNGINQDGAAHNIRAAATCLAP
jgi:hypothetical protein